MLRNNVFLGLMIISFYSCGQKNVNNILDEKPNAVILEVRRMVDSISNSLPLDYRAPLYTVTYQEKDDKDYMKISTAEYFNKDSVSTYEVYNNHLVIFYSTDFFKNKLDTLRIQGLEAYEGLAYTDETISLYHPRYEVIEILKNNQFRILPTAEHHQKKLFYFDDRYIPEPIPSDSTLNK